MLDLPPPTQRTSLTAPTATSPTAPARRLKLLDRYLTVWIFAAMALGVALGILRARAAAALDQLQRRHHHRFRSPIGLILMMYPPLAKVRYEELGKVFRDTRVLVLSLVQNWVIGPVLMFALAVALPARPSRVHARSDPHRPRALHRDGASSGTISRKGDSRVLRGPRRVQLDLPGAVLLASTPTFFATVLPPLARARGRRRRHHASVEIAKSVAIYLGIPFAAGFLTRLRARPREGATSGTRARSCRASARSRWSRCCSRSS